jgi:hypothetical protein
MAGCFSGPCQQLGPGLYRIGQLQTFEQKIVESTIRNNSVQRASTEQGGVSVPGMIRVCIENVCV